MSKEFELSDSDFEKIRVLVREHTGISLSEGKRDMVYSRLARRLRQLGVADFKKYCSMLEDSSNPEIGNFINSVTTNLTAFFREDHHFQFLKTTLLPNLMKQNQATRKIRIWSAGCSTGEEPYSIAMTVREVISESSGWDVKILATDLDTNVLATGQSGVYTEDRIKGVPASVVKKWFLRGKGGSQGKVRVSQELRDMITFRQLNLMGEWPIKNKMDLIFCRNVVIYFDKPTQKILFDRYANALRDDGHLFVGHSETLYKVSDRFSLLGQTIYRKTH